MNDGAFEYPAALRVADRLRERYTGTAAIIFYGSCLRDRDTGGLLDFYVLVDSTREALGAVAGLFAQALPPSVYYFEFDEDLRAKVAVMNLRQFLCALGPRQFTSAVSARFAQPAAVVFARDGAVSADLAAGFATAAETTIARTLPLMPARFTVRDLWRRAFTESFAAELRPEGETRITSLVDSDMAFYTALTRRILGEAIDGAYRHSVNAAAQDSAIATWRRRRIVGKALNAARLIKAAFTFRGGLDYAAWKIKRHSGVEIAVTDNDRRKPLRAGLRLFAETLRRGGLK
ncbi:MAG: hypothetical protein ACYCZX_12985 [Rhodospirillaceae bacterium]